MLIEVLFALLAALILTAIFAAGFKRTGPWGNFWIFFLILFLAAWAGGLWISPAGPLLYGTAILPFFFMALIFALLLAAIPPHAGHKVETISEVKEEEKQEKAAAIALDIFFWVLIIIFISAIIFAYFV